MGRKTRYVPKCSGAQRGHQVRIINVCQRGLPPRQIHHPNNPHLMSGKAKKHRQYYRFNWAGLLCLAATLVFEMLLLDNVHNKTQL